MNNETWEARQEIGRQRIRTKEICDGRDAIYDVQFSHDLSNPEFLDALAMVMSSVASEIARDEAAE